MNMKASTAVLWVVTLLTGFFGNMLGKSMQESRSMFWAWLIRFFKDVPVFAFSTMATLAARGF